MTLAVHFGTDHFFTYRPRNESNEVYNFCFLLFWVVSNYVHHSLEVLIQNGLFTHVGKYDRANDRPKLAMLAIDIGPMIDRGLDDNCGPILAFYIGPKIAPDYWPRITARVLNL